MLDAWKMTVSALSGRPAPAMAWPEAKTRRITMWDALPASPERSPSLGDGDRALVASLLRRPMTAGELAVRTGMTRDCASARLAWLRAHGLVTRSGACWECTYAGRSAATVPQEFDHPQEAPCCC